MQNSDVNDVVAIYGYTAERPTAEQWAAFMEDMDEGDKFEAGQTWRKDWKAELEATFEAATSLFAISSPDHDGFAMFGLTALGPEVAQIWLLQSKSFVAGASAHHGMAWPNKAAKMTAAIVQRAQSSHQTIFNFIAKSRDQNVRLLKSAGFDFFDHPEKNSSMAFFSVGPHGFKMSKDPEIWRAFLGEDLH